MSNEFQGFLAGTGCFEKKAEKITRHQTTGGPFWGAFGALKVLSTVDPATLCSSNRMEIIPQSDFNILTKIMPRNAKDMDVHYCAFWGKVHLFAQKCTFGAGEKKEKNSPMVRKPRKPT